MTRATFDQDYRDLLQTLSEGSVRWRFDPYLDIDWDSPEFAVTDNDPRWILPKTDPMGAAVSMKSPAAATGSRPPFPSERPASRYAGIGDRANRRATAPNTASVATHAAPNAPEAMRERATTTSTAPLYLHSNAIPPHGSFP